MNSINLHYPSLTTHSTVCQHNVPQQFATPCTILSLSVSHLNQLNVLRIKSLACLYKIWHLGPWSSNLKMQENVTKTKQLPETLHFHKKSGCDNHNRKHTLLTAHTGSWW